MATFPSGPVIAPDRLAQVSRRLRARADAILGIVWFIPEARDGYGLGLTPAEGNLAARAACLGRVPGTVAAAAFAPLEPGLVARAVDRALDVTDPETLLDQRLRACERALDSLDVDRSEIRRTVALVRRAAEAGTIPGHPVYAGLRSLPWPEDPVGALWRACDLVREHRGDSHVHAWMAADLDSVEINILSERWRGEPVGSVTTVQMGWSSSAVHDGVERLRGRGLLDHDELSDSGRELRDRIEAATDSQERGLVSALGTDADDCLELLTPWARAVTAGAEAWWESGGSTPSSAPASS